MSIFINRYNELKMLENRFKDKKSEFLIIYGRRRVGKTELIKRFYKDKLHLYYLCSRENDSLQLQKLVKRTADFFNEREPVINSWEEFFSYLKEKSNKRLIVVIDEFPYMVEKNNAIPSLFQLGWDEYLKDSKIFLILLGSSISMMESLLGYKSPIYGRRTGQIEVNPLKIKDSFKFFPKYDIDKKIEAYSIIGNIPMYLLEFDDSKSIINNIRDNMLRADAILYKEPLFLLREELREPGIYITILENIADKPIKMSELSTKTNIEVTKLPKYLKILQELKFVKKLTKVTEKKVKTKNTLYTINDNFFRFWFKFINPNLSDIEGGDKEKVINIIKSELNSFVGKSFENICKEFLIDNKSILPFNFSRIGVWWGYYREGKKREEVEIDLVAVGDSAIGFFECKWQSLNYKKAKEIIHKLIEKAKHVSHEGNKYFGLIAKNIKNKEKLKREGYLVFDLKDFKKTGWVKR